VPSVRTVGPDRDGVEVLSQTTTVALSLSKGCLSSIALRTRTVLRQAQDNR
jgi:hypothetical protein